jgi:ATP-dependent Clp protease adapter protein ClpS
MKQDRQLRGTVTRAVARARAAGRPPSVYDLFAALIEVPEVHLMIHRTGGNADVLASELESAAASVAEPGLLERLAWRLGSDAPFHRVVDLASRRRVAAAKDDVRAADVFAAGFDAGDQRLVTALEAAGLSRLTILRWLCDPEASPVAIPDGHSLDVLILNDDFTSMDTVVRMLTGTFGLEQQGAMATMLAVHHQGRGLVGRFEREEAIRRARAGTAMAEAEGSPLRIVLSAAEPLPVGASADPLSPPSGERPTRRGVLSGVTGRLTWGASPGAAAPSPDAVIAASGIAALAVWFAFDRYRAGASAFWFPSGLVGITWYAAGLFVLAWVLHRASGALGDFRSIVAAVIGPVPFVLGLALAFSRWVPERSLTPYVLISAGAVFFHARRALARVGAVRPRTGLLAAGTFIMAFAWGTEHAFVQAHVWYPATDDDEPAEWTDSERLLFEQPDRIDAAVARLSASDRGRPDVFFLGFAGVGEEKVFAEEAKLAERVVSERYGAAGRTLLLLNDRRDLEGRPLATVPGLQRALARLGERMDRSKDVLFLLLTSHGSAKMLSVSNSTWPLKQLDAPTLRKALDAARIKWRIIVISACHSGAFIPALMDDNTAVLTSAAADRVSFGCADDRDSTEFGRSFLREALPAATLAAAFEQAKKALAEEERRQNIQASLPQARFGARLLAHWELIEAQHAPRSANGR